MDILAVLSPPYFHPEQAAAAVDAGLHVWLAKPIAIDVPGVLSIEASAKKATENKRCFLVDFQTRSFAHYHEAARLVAAGNLGTLGYGEIAGNCTAFPLKVPPDSPAAKLKNWLQWKGLCGESIVEYSIHAIDMARLLVGRAPVRATGRCERRFLDHIPVPTPGDVRDIWLADYEFDDDLRLSFRGLRFSGHGLPGFSNLHVNLYGMSGNLSADYSGEVFIKGEKPFSGDQFMNEKNRGIS
jgi:predicted dehydrogenase